MATLPQTDLDDLVKSLLQVDTTVEDTTTDNNLPPTEDANKVGEIIDELVLSLFQHKKFDYPRIDGIISTFKGILRVVVDGHRHTPSDFVRNVSKNNRVFVNMVRTKLIQANVIQQITLRDKNYFVVNTEQLPAIRQFLLGRLSCIR